MKKIKRFLLVDDSDSTNFFNKMIIQKTELVDEILIAKNGIEALEYINSGIVPELIFLDLNMPKMNGWDFLSEFQKLEENYRKSTIILMVGAQLSASEEKLALGIREVKEFRDKMLTKEIVIEITEKYLHEELTPL